MAASRSLPIRKHMDDFFFASMAGLILLTVFIGFAQTYYLAGMFHAPLPRSSRPFSWRDVFMLDSPLHRADRSCLLESHSVAHAPWHFRGHSCGSHGSCRIRDSHCRSATTCRLRHGVGHLFCWRCSSTIHVRPAGRLGFSGAQRWSRAQASHDLGDRRAVGSSLSPLAISLCIFECSRLFRNARRYTDSSDRL